MVIEDLKYGRCASCGSEEIYQSEIYISGSGRFSICKPGTFFKARRAEFSAFVCAWCGFVQWHLKLDDRNRDWLRRTLPPVPSSPAQPPAPPQPPEPPQPSM
ncbi:MULTISPECIES: hypothetical protein [unclassified Streptomyces]|uniref:hypothetical protein n=1 Tax=unclassified Streptomyces TaxID=2593676 RepID=UPI00336A50FD